MSMKTDPLALYSPEISVLKYVSFVSPRTTA